MSMKKIISVLAVLATVTLFSGCANVATATLMPGTDLSRVKSFYVISHPGDKNGVDKLIQGQLTKMGYTVKVGPELTGSSYGTDATVRYLDKWMWDITMYMIELTITLRNPSNDFPLAKGNSMHTSLTRKSAEEMVEEVLTNIFKAPKA